MKTRTRCRLGLVQLLARRFSRSERGVTAIEFAILGPVFFLLIGATLETALVFFAGHTLDSAVHDGSRLIRTGQAQHMSATDYRDGICARTYSLFDCDQLQVSVSGMSSFSNYTPASPIDPDTGNWLVATQFEDSARNGRAIVLVEAYYKWPVFFNIPGLSMGETADGRRLLATAKAFYNEPF